MPPASPSRFFSRRQAQEYSFKIDADGVCLTLTVHNAVEEYGPT